MAAADPGTVASVLARAWPDARCELLARDPWELLVAAVLSARTSDQQVNKVMAVLTEHLVGVEAYARLDHRRLARLIARLPLYPQKARSIVEAARRVHLRHGGRVPQTMAELAALPGIGRKTAAVVLGNAFGIPAVAADSHVQRVARRLGWSTREHPRDAEQALVERFPPQHWVGLCHQIIRLGRLHCRPLRPKCATCPMSATCPREGVPDPA
jgi:endonuclease-3